MSELTQHQKEDKAFITRPGHYPNWPYLPMKRYGKEGLQAGTIIDRIPLGKPVDPTHECFRTVYLLSIWQSAAEKKPFSDAEKLVYESVDAMLLDGWQVD